MPEVTLGGNSDGADVVGGREKPGVLGDTRNLNIWKGIRVPTFNDQKIRGNYS
jgi:hypothetical protein